MKQWKAVFFSFLILVFIWAMGKPWGPLPALGPFLHPSIGFWAQAVPADADLSFQGRVAGIKRNVFIEFDERKIPHVRAQTLEDAYFCQGYLHACFRLWQMDMQTRAAAGRLSEILGPQALDFDRKQRYKGMVFGAENSLAAMMADSLSRTVLTAYTQGVNAFIRSLTYRQFPLEYKLMGFEPEPWTPLKTALLLKYMADDLSGNSQDLQRSALYQQWGDSVVEQLYPDRLPHSVPFIPRSTRFDFLAPAAPASLPDYGAPVPLPANFPMEVEGKGSNAWVIHGTKTDRGHVLLANDPHLRLGLPSLWFEMQIQAPGLNCYGVSLPGAPGIIIGFNDRIAWGLTNNYQDVKDYYLLELDPEKGVYAYGDERLPWIPRPEFIAVKGSDTVRDTVYYSVHGPLEYPLKETWATAAPRAIAMSWTGHDSTNELQAICLINQAQDLPAFKHAISHFQCPAQNFVYGDIDGNIAGFAQGKWIQKQKGQGRYLQSGKDPRTRWKGAIPFAQIPQVVNPEQGFIQAANQVTTGPEYPYWYRGSFSDFRSWRIQALLSSQPSFAFEDMKRIQLDAHDVLAGKALPLMLGLLEREAIRDPKVEAAIQILEKWDFRMAAEQIAPSYFHLWWTHWREAIWHSVLPGVEEAYWPGLGQTLFWMETQLGPRSQSQSSHPAQAVKAAELDTWREALVQALQEAIADIEAQYSGDARWARVQPGALIHLSRLEALSIRGLSLDGSATSIQAQKPGYGPGWRMIVELDSPLVAVGIYAGGQSGNPGSPAYDAFVEPWAEGNYFPLHFLPRDSSLPAASLNHQWTLIAR